MTTEMRVLTVRQPWAWAIIHGGKDIENRVRNLAGEYRGPVAIHAGLAPVDQDNLASRTHRRAHGSSVDTGIFFGAIIGVVDLLAVIEPHERCEFCSPWAIEGNYHLALGNPRALRKPIPYRGALGLRRLEHSAIELIKKELQ